jgi:oligogalacturonide lyase
MEYWRIFKEDRKMVGTVYPSEKRVYQDRKSGVQVTQLTSRGINYHFYFTENSFDRTDKEIYFLSNRGNEGAEICNLFRMDLESGEMVQLTDDPTGVEAGRITKTPDSEYIAYVTGKQLRLYNARTGENRLLHLEESMLMHDLSFSCDKKKISFTRDEDVNALPDGGPNYAGFKEKMFATKDGRIATINLDGSGFHDVFRDTHWLSHFQYSPDDPDLAMFCHEGPWNYVHQRIWLINMKTAEVWPCFRQGEDDCVGHEFWTRDGDIIFDNRRGGHDGTISSKKTQVYAEKRTSTEIPYFGFAHKDGIVYRKIDMPFYCNHYFANAEVSLFVGDAVDDIVLIQPDEQGKAKVKVLAEHGTTWHYQRSHCHPTFSWDGKKLLYAADTDRWHDNLFLVDVPETM